MQTKSFDLQIKEAREDAPGIVAYASTFDRIPDAYGDVVAKGAFAGTLARLAENGYNLPLLYGHVMDNPSNIIGTVTKAVEDDHGLLVEATFDMDNPAAAQVRRAILAKAINKLSFAFSILDSKSVELEDGTEARELRELEIYEVSIVVVPANPRAAVVAAKDAEPEQKMSEEDLAVDTAEETETETEPEVKTEEPIEAKAEEPMAEEKAEEAEAPEPVNPISEKENIMDIETMNAIGSAQPAEKGLKEIISETIAQKGGSNRFHVTTPEIKSATWMGAPTIQEYSHRVAQAKFLIGVADLFNRYTLSEGNTYVYVPLTPKDGAPAATNEGAEKPLFDFSKTPVAEPLVNYAGIMKVSEQCIEDAAWLVSAIEGRGVDTLKYVLDGAALAAITGATGISAVTATSDLMADILTAAGDVQANSGYFADAVILNPADFYALLAAERVNPTSYFNADYTQILGMQIVLSNDMTSSEALVGAFKAGATFATKGGIKVDMTNSNEDDFTHNLVAIRVEQRAAFVCEIPGAFAYIS